MALSLPFREPTSPMQGHAAHRLKLAISETISFAVDLYDHPSHSSAVFPAGMPGKNERRLQRALSESFDDSLLVQPHALDQIFDQLQSDGFHLVYGPRGVGKSTLFHAIRQQFSNMNEVAPEGASKVASYFAGKDPWGIDLDDTVFDSTASVLFLYVNYRASKSKADIVGENGHGLNSSADDIFRLAYTEAKRKLRESNLLDSWYKYRAFTHVFFQEFMESASFEELAGTPDLDKELYRLQGQFERLKIFTRFYAVTRFYHNILGARTIVCVDNLDQAEARTQLSILRDLITVASSNPPITVLTASRAYTQAQLTRDKTPDLSQLPHHLRHTAALDARGESGESDETDPTNYLPAGPAGVKLDEKTPDMALFPEIIRRRLDFLADIGDETVEIAADVGSSLNKDAETLGLSSLRHCVNLLWVQIYRVYADEMSDDRELGKSSNGLLDLLRWHNGSIRSAGTHVCYLAASLLLGSDRIFANADRTIDKAVAARDSKNIFYRSMILGPRTPPESPAAPLVYNGDEPAAHGPTPPFQRYLLLRRLERAPDGVTMDQLVIEFENIGLQYDALCHHLVELSCPRGFESEGMLRIEGGQSVHGRVSGLTTDELSISTDSRIYLRLSGKWFLRALVRSVEYLFWSAFYDDEEMEVGPELERLGLLDPSRENRLTPEMIRDDEVRVLVAAMYLRHVLFSRSVRYISDLSASSGRRQQSGFAARSVLRPFYGNNYEAGNEIVALIGQIRAFVRKMDRPSMDVTRSVERLLTDMELRLASIRPSLAK